MAAPKRTEAQRELDLVKISDMYLRGVPQAEIAVRLRVTRQQIGYDLKVLYRRWRADANHNVDDFVAAELARIDRLEREAWEGWRKSCDQAEKTVTQRFERDGSKGASVRVEKSNSSGDPRFLQVIGRCIERRCQLLGLDRPVKIEHSGQVEYVPIREIVAEIPAEERLN